MYLLLKSLAVLIISATSIAALELECPTNTGVLKGTLEAVEGQKSTIVLIHPGSGPTDRDGNTPMLPGKNNSLKLLSENLKVNHIPSLRIDKRGIAASKAAGPKEEDLRFQSYVDDTCQWITLLKQQGYQKVVVLGHSEGALIGLLACKKKTAAAYISVAGPARPADEILLEQLKPKLQAHPALWQQTEQTIAHLKKGETTDQFPAALHSLFRPSVQPYLISWMKFDPAHEISQLRLPILILQGTTDVQVPVSAAKTLHQKAPKSKLVIIDGMNHILKDIQGDLTAQIPSYSNPDLAVNQQLCTAIVNFVKQLTAIPAKK